MLNAHSVLFLIDFELGCGKGAVRDHAKPKAYELQLKTDFVGFSVLSVSVRISKINAFAFATNASLVTISHSISSFLLRVSEVGRRARFSTHFLHGCC